jgi:hypothetical protein
MNKATIGLIGIAAIATACERNERTVVKFDDGKAIIKKTNYNQNDDKFYNGDSVIVYKIQGPKFTFYKFDGNSSIDKIVIKNMGQSNGTYFKNEALDSPAETDDMLFISADYLWKNIVNTAKNQELDWILASALAVDRIYNPLNFVETSKIQR